MEGISVWFHQVIQVYFFRSSSVCVCLCVCVRVCLCVCVGVRVRRMERGAMRTAALANTPSTHNHLPHWLQRTNTHSQTLFSLQQTSISLSVYEWWVIRPTFYITVVLGFFLLWWYYNITKRKDILHWNMILTFSLYSLSLREHI